MQENLTFSEFIINSSNRNMLKPTDENNIVLKESVGDLVEKQLFGLSYCLNSTFAPSDL